MVGCRALPRQLLKQERIAQILFPAIFLFCSRRTHLQDGDVGLVGISDFHAVDLDELELGKVTHLDLFLQIRNDLSDGGSLACSWHA